jgi:hypothetical protein
LHSLFDPRKYCQLISAYDFYDFFGFGWGNSTKDSLDPNFPQLAAFFTSALMLASSVAVSSFSD